MSRTPVAIAELGPEAGMVGAATMAALELKRGGAQVVDGEGAGWRDG
jgi:hypothetical protein